MQFNANAAKRFIAHCLRDVVLPIPVPDPNQDNKFQCFIDAPFSHTLRVSRDEDKLLVSFDQVLASPTRDAIGIALQDSILDQGRQIVFCTTSQGECGTVIAVHFSDAKALDRFLEQMQQSVGSPGSIRNGLTGFRGR